MQHYYEGHEQKYQQIKTQNKTSWDEGLDQAEDFESFCLKNFLEVSLKHSTFEEKQPKGLELGCGTGPSCCFLAKQGFQMTGFDVSATAIELAKEQAQKRDLSIQYKVLDICKTELLANSYDMILDAHFLHCVVFRQEREKVLQNIATALKPNGYFWLETMIGYPNLQFGEKTIYDEEGVLWNFLGEKKPSYHEAEQKEGKWYLPTRRIYRDKSEIINELSKLPLKIIWSQFNEDGENPADLQVICQLAT